MSLQEPVAAPPPAVPRRAPRPSRRRFPPFGRAAWLLLGAGALLAVGASAAWPLLIVLWIGANVLLLFTAGCWALFHPRAVRPGAPAALRWAFALTLLVALFLNVLLDTLAVVTQGLFPPLPPRLAPLFLLLVAPLAFFVLFGAGLLGGAALGAFAAARRRSDDGDAVVPDAVLGVGAWWVATLLGLLAANLASSGGRAGEAAAGGIGFALMSVPAGTLACWRLARSRRLDVFRRLRQTLRALGHVPTLGRRRAPLDLRGAALGLVAGLFALCLTTLGVLRPLQTAWLAERMENSNALGEWAGRFRRLERAADDETANRPQKPSKREPSPASRLILLKMDGATLAAVARGDTSETAVQARAVRKLRTAGARRIVVPAPLLDPNGFSRLRATGRGGDEPARVPDSRAEKAAVARARRDLPVLIAALRAAGDTALLTEAPLPPERASGINLRVGPGAAPPSADAARFARLLHAAARVARPVALSAYENSARLPALPSWNSESANAPVLLAAALRRPAGNPPFPGSAGPRLIDFRDDPALGPFARIAYDSLLRSGATDFVGKIVFLDALAPREVDTPLGARAEPEVLAYATATLLKDPITRPNAPTAALLTLLAAALVGQICTGRAPLDALWRIAVPLILFVGYALARFFANVWVDPVVPLVATGGAFLLATQLTYGQEKQERERNRTLLGRFLAPQLLDELLRRDPEHPLHLGGERRHVCVLFADVRNFTGFAETHTPEQVIEAVNRYMTALTHALHAHRGILDKYTGDGLMALFSESALVPARPALAPDESRHALLIAQAVRAALDMQGAVQALSRERTAENLPALAVGIGLHFGEAVVGLVGNPVHIINYTALGHAVVVCARLQGVAAGGEVIVSETVHEAVRGLFTVEARDPITVKGLSAPVHPYRVLAAAPAQVTQVTAAPAKKESTAD